jgi:hypothetical protein
MNALPEEAVRKDVERVLDMKLPMDGVTAEAVTVTRLWRCDNRYHMTAFEGRTIAPRRKLTGNSAPVEISELDVVAGGSVPERFDRLLHAGMPHHVLLSFGSHAETFRRLARALEVEWLT